MASPAYSPATLALNSIASPPQTQSAGVAAFISKVWNILENEDYQRLISWSEVRLDYTYCKCTLLS